MGLHGPSENLGLNLIKELGLAESQYVTFVHRGRAVVLRGV